MQEQPTFSSVIKQITSNQELQQPEVDCSEVDIKQIEQVGKEITSYLVNVDISSAQFDVDAVIDQASKLGMDFGDLEEYGLDFKSAKCGGKTCFNKDQFKNYDDILFKGGKIGEKLGQEGVKLYRRAS